jgi:IS30 family transposase
MRKNVTEKEKEKMWRLYQTLCSYTKVAKKVKRNPDTVSKYVKEYEAAVRAAGVVLHAKENAST